MRISWQLGGRLVVGALVGWLAACNAADAAPTTGASGDDSANPSTDDDVGDSIRVCTTGPIRCLVHFSTDASGHIKSHASLPRGFEPADLEAAYGIDPTTVVGAPTIALVNAYGYAALESDLAMYRSQFSLPACTVANGCLKIFNQQGQTTPLPADPPQSDDWTVEGALDLDMASAACPMCKIVIVEADTADGSNLYAGEDIAASMNPTVISNSWGGPEDSTVPASETHFDHPGIAIFTAAGDAGYNDQFETTGSGPDYPGTSAHVIAVGATHLSKDLSTRGWAETAWSVTGTKDKSAGGSACSGSIPKPAYQSDSPCQFKATTDIAAVGDPATGVAIYNAANQGWVQVGGTSAASPFIAGMFAATGNGTADGSFVAANAAKLNDVTTGNNGTCDSAKLCNAGVGWDGPTGYGTPNAALIINTKGSGGGSGGSGDGSGSDGGGGCGGCSTGSASGGGAGALVVLGLGLMIARRRRAA